MFVPTGKTGVTAAVILLIFLAGGCLRAVPDVVGMQDSEAEGFLASAGFALGTVARQVSATVAAGRVISQDPAAGAHIEEGSAVNLVVSLGPEPVDVVVPDVTGLDRAAAQTALLLAGLVMGSVTREFSETVPFGQIISQQPPAGAKAAAGTRVDIVVSKGGEPMPVPDLTGMTLAEAEDALAAAGLALGAVTEQYDDEAPAGAVLSQEPLPEMIVGRGEAVSLVISKGPAPILVPQVVGMTLAGAESALRLSGLTLGLVTEQYDDVTPAGRVVAQDPLPSTVLHHGDPVAVTVSKGPQPIPAPLLIGMTLAEAEDALTTAGLTVGAVTEQYDDNMLPGRILSQNPEAGIILYPGDAVALVISIGPEPVAVPPVVGLTETGAEAALAAVRLVVGSVSYAYSLTIPAGTVIEQTPAAGTVVLPFTSVDLIVSQGPRPVTVPDVTGAIEADAEAALAAVGLQVGAITEEYRLDVAPGTVVGQQPQAGAVVDEGSAVDLVIATDYKPISTIEELQLIGNDPEYPLYIKYALANDIDASQTAQWNGGAGFNPIGTVVGGYDNSFTGMFDGRGHAIAGLVIKSGLQSANLFCVVEGGAVVRDLRLTELHAQSRMAVAGIAQVNRGVISNCSITGRCLPDSVMATPIVAGGLVALNEGGIVSGCMFEGEVGGADWFGGGIVGWNKGSVEDCRFSGDVIGLGGGGDGYAEYYGGVVGYNESGPVTGCTAAGTVSTWTYAVGGIVGYNNGIVSDCFSTSKVSVNGGGVCGGVAGESHYTIFKCGASGAVYLLGAGGHCGGLVGANYGNVETSFAVGPVFSNASETGGLYWPGTGGLTGLNRGPVTDCFSTSFVNGQSDCGGLIGENTSTVVRCYSAGTVRCTTVSGGLVGVNSGAVSDSFWCTESSGQTASAGGAGMSLESLLDPTVFASAGWDYGDGDGNPAVWAQLPTTTVPYLAWSVVPGETHGLEASAVNGSVEADPTTGACPAWTFVTLEPHPQAPHELAGWDLPELGIFDVLQADKLYVAVYGHMSVLGIFLPRPVEIDSIEEIQRIGHEAQYPLHWDYVLTANLDGSVTAGWNDGAGFDPIGDLRRPFRGDFDGQGFKIGNLFINRPYERDIGVFGAIGEEGAVTNLNVLNATVSAGWTAGLVAGMNLGSISNCRVSGSITGHSCIGGVAGMNGPEDIYDLEAPFPQLPGLIYKCQAAVTVSGRDDYGLGIHGYELGGLAGANTATMQQSAATGSVTGSENVGGFAGIHFIGLIEDCYATGDVTGGDYTGGFLGVSALATVRRSYSAGHITAEPYYYDTVDGFIGGIWGYAAVEACFWDGETSGLYWNPTWGSAKTTAEMMSSATFTDMGWDFINVWGIDEGNSYPSLLWEADAAEK